MYAKVWRQEIVTYSGSCNLVWLKVGQEKCQGQVSRSEGWSGLDLAEGEVARLRYSLQGALFLLRANGPTCFMNSDTFHSYYSCHFLSSVEHWFLHLGYT